MKYSVAILAAGAGTRMKSALSKVLHKICGKEILSYIIEEALVLSDDVSVIIYHQKEALQEFLSANYPSVRVVVQDHSRFPGTGGAVMGLDPKYENVLILNGDMPLVRGGEIQKMAGAKMAIAAMRLEDPQGYGRIITSSDGELTGIVEEKDATEQQKEIKLVNAGVYFLRASFLREALPKLKNDNAQGEFYITDLVKIAASAGEKIAVFEFGAQDLTGVNSKLDLSNAEMAMQARINARLMQAGVIMHLPHTIFISAQASFEGECEIESGVVIKGRSKIISSKILAGSVIEDAVIEHSSVGPMARIRPQSHLKNTAVGNFVETKNARLDGVKAGHLSYLGDADLGSGTNVGAGTITCNYDGKQKHKTIIGKNVFIGSDTQLVAPVSVADDVIIAAGTTVTDDIPSGSLAISRTKQANVKDFFKKFFNAAKK
ncbi:MAG: bifunctional UDP-N-acetylglucosamine diphosphorylase/glucosamine-1-phosphate N-acetyltransferase GlmU [Helicobacteraceae bacterium]